MNQVILSNDQLNFYWNNGYLVLKELIDFTTLYACKQRFIQICKGVVDKGNITVMKELALINKGLQGENLINKLQDIAHDDIFTEYIEHKELLEVISQIIGTNNMMAIHSMFINKPPGTGRHPAHQDLYYFPMRPEDKITAAWTAIDHVNVENGCLFVVPGSHLDNTLYEHGYPEDMLNNKAYHGIKDEQLFKDKMVNLEMSPGDTVFFHPNLVHGSGPNVSQNYRKSISCHYAAKDCHYIDVKGTTQEHLSKEVELMGRKKGFELTFSDIWKYKSKEINIKSHL